MHKWVLKELADLTVRPPRIILQMSPRSGEAADDREKANVAPVVEVGQERDLGTAGRSASPQSSGMGWDRNRFQPCAGRGWEGSSQHGRCRGDGVPQLPDGSRSQAGRGQSGAGPSAPPPLGPSGLRPAPVPLPRPPAPRWGQGARAGLRGAAGAALREPRLGLPRAQPARPVLACSRWFQPVPAGSPRDRADSSGAPGDTSQPIRAAEAGRVGPIGGWGPWPQSHKGTL